MSLFGFCRFKSIFQSPFDGGLPGEPKSKKIRIGATRILQSNITAPVISSATNCLLVAAKGNKVGVEYAHSLLSHCCVIEMQNKREKKTFFDSEHSARARRVPSNGGDDYHAYDPIEQVDKVGKANTFHLIKLPFLLL